MIKLAAVLLLVVSLVFVSGCGDNPTAPVTTDPGTVVGLWNGTATWGTIGGNPVTQSFQILIRADTLRCILNGYEWHTTQWSAHDPNVSWTSTFDYGGGNVIDLEFAGTRSKNHIQGGLSNSLGVAAGTFTTTWAAANGGKPDFGSR